MTRMCWVRWYPQTQSPVLLLWMEQASQARMAFSLQDVPLAAWQSRLDWLLAQWQADPKGDALAHRHPQGGVASPLYAAPSNPGGLLAWLGEESAQWAPVSDAPLVWRPLCADVWSLQPEECWLTALPKRYFWASIRNWNRVVAGAATERAWRWQALTRFPHWLAPVLLTAHHQADWGGGKRHAWRDHSDAVTAALAAGHNLVDALAAHWQVSRSLIKGPLGERMWGYTGLSHKRLAVVMDHVPAQARPSVNELQDSAVFWRWMADMCVTDGGLCGWADKDLRKGLSTLLNAAEKALGAGNDLVQHPDGAGASELWLDAPGLGQIDDFFRAVSEAFRVHPPAWQPLVLPADDAFDAGWPALARAEWMSVHGLVHVARATARWHRWLQQRSRAPFSRQPWPVLVGEAHWEGVRLTELPHAEALAHEGEVMHHCVASYARECERGRSRFFSVCDETGGAGERATLQLDLLAPVHDPCYDEEDEEDEDLPVRAAETLQPGPGCVWLVALLGPCNAQPASGLTQRLHAWVAHLNTGRFDIAWQNRWNGVRQHTPPAEAAPPQIDPTSRVQALQIWSGL